MDDNEDAALEMIEAVSQPPFFVRDRLSGLKAGIRSEHNHWKDEKLINALPFYKEIHVHPWIRQDDLTIDSAEPRDEKRLHEMGRPRLRCKTTVQTYFI